METKLESVNPYPDCDYPEECKNCDFIKGCPEHEEYDLKELFEDAEGFGWIDTDTLKKHYGKGEY